MTRAAILAVALLGACGTFEEPSIVLDLRVIAMRTDIGTSFPTKADQVVDVDLTKQPELGNLLSQLQTTSVTAWVADPGQNRHLAWSMQLCLPDEEGRCDLTLPHIAFGAGEIDDPEEASSAQRPFAQILPGDSQTGQTMVGMLLRAIEADPVQALGGVDLMIELRVGGVADPRENDLYAAKKLRISPRIPIERAANTNPSITGIETAVNGLGGIDNLPGASGGQGARCSDPSTRQALRTQRRIDPGDIVTLFPDESTNTRENYAVPGLDGTTILLEESVSYQWLTTYGNWSDETTGGGHDVLGNQSLLGSDWTAPNIGGRDFLDVSLWMIQRDERLGVTPFETCIRVGEEP